MYQVMRPLARVVAVLILLSLSEITGDLFGAVEKKDRVTIALLTALVFVP